MTVQVQLDEAKKRLSDLIEAAIRGEEVLIVTEEHKAVRLAPVEGADTEKTPGKMSRFWASFGAWRDDRPVEATLRDIHEARRSRKEPPEL